MQGSGKRDKNVKEKHEELQGDVNPPTWQRDMLLASWQGLFCVRSGAQGPPFLVHHSHNPA